MSNYSNKSKYSNNNYYINNSNLSICLMCWGGRLFLKGDRRLDLFCFTKLLTFIDFIRAFLTGLRQRVRVNRSYSTWKNVINGVPQGSVLGPMLFTLYVWDVPQVVIIIILFV